MASSDVTESVKRRLLPAVAGLPLLLACLAGAEPPPDPQAVPRVDFEAVTATPPRRPEDSATVPASPAAVAARSDSLSAAAPKADPPPRPEESIDSPVPVWLVYPVVLGGFYAAMALLHGGSYSGQSRAPQDIQVILP